MLYSYGVFFPLTVRSLNTVTTKSIVLIFVFTNSSSSSHIYLIKDVMKMKWSTEPLL